MNEGSSQKPAKGSTGLLYNISGKDTNKANKYQEPPPINPVFKQYGWRIFILAFVLFLLFDILGALNLNAGFVVVAFCLTIFFIAIQTWMAAEHSVQKLGPYALMMAELIITIVLYSGTSMSNTIIDLIKLFRGGK